MAHQAALKGCEFVLTDPDVREFKVLHALPVGMLAFKLNLGGMTKSLRTQHLDIAAALTLTTFLARFTPDRLAQRSSQR